MSFHRTGINFESNVIDDISAGKRTSSAGRVKIPSTNSFFWKLLNPILPILTTAFLLLFLVSFVTNPDFPITKQNSESTKGAYRETTSSAKTDEGLPKHKFCFIYDKAPRTGSTTIAKTLASCWRSLPGISVTVRKGQFTSAITTLLSSPNSVAVALVGSHFFITSKDVISLKNQCNEIFYITSTRNMYERLWSEAKYYVSKADIRHNTSLSVDSLSDVWSTLLSNLSTSEKYFEKYPHISQFNESTVSEHGNMSEELTPTYIVRTEYMHRDLSMLLDSFGCSELGIQVTNMHTIELVVPEPMKSHNSCKECIHQNMPINLTSLRLQYNDQRHKKLSQLASKINHWGLSIAKAAKKSIDEK